MRFMVIINMNGSFDKRCMAAMGKDNGYSQRLRAEGIQGELFVRDDLQKCWCLFNVDSSESLQHILEGFPFHNRLDYEVYPLLGVDDA